MDYIQIYWTCGSLDEARDIARKLVQMRLVACANIIPWVESIFMWNESLDTAQETKVIFKTRDDRFEQVKQFILEHAKYEVPEILKVPILDGNPEYLKWVSQNTEPVESKVSAS
jgi:periplasmic divalent cation tolerance protein